MGWICGKQKTSNVAINFSWRFHQSHMPLPVRLLQFSVFRTYNTPEFDIMIPTRNEKQELQRLDHPTYIFLTQNGPMSPFFIIIAKILDCRDFINFNRLLDLKRSNLIIQCRLYRQKLLQIEWDGFCLVALLLKFYCSYFSKQNQFFRIFQF